MAKAGRTFSEFWYRVADRHIALRPQVHVRRQTFRGERWILLHDPFNNQFFRLRPAAYDFVARLRAGRTVREAWEEHLAAQPEEGIGQEDAIHLLAQLYFANLLHYDRPADSEKFFERYRKRRQRERRGRWLNIMFARFPLLDPDAWLNRALPYVRFLFGPAGALLWLVVVGLAAKVIVENAGALWEQTQRVLAPDNLFLLYVGLALVKGLHEFGHAFACKRYGGEVHTMGIMLLVFTPVPYIDVTSAWAFRARRCRLLVSAAGVLVELFVAGVAALTWAATGPGTLHALCYNVMFIASVSTLLFNGNPLLRYDGYYLLADLVDIPNLSQRSLRQLRYLAERYLFGRRQAVGAADSRGEAAFMVVYGVLSFTYRLFVFSGMILVVARRYLVVGLIMAGVCIVSWGIVPLARFMNYLLTDPSLERRRGRATAATAAVAAAVLILLAVVPFPSRFLAPGLLSSDGHVEVVNATAGRLAEVLAPSGSRVEAGQPLARLENADLADALAAADARIAQAEALRRRALDEGAADLAPIEEHLAAVRRERDRIVESQRALVVRAPGPGVWSAPELDPNRGAWLARGSTLGDIVDPAAFHFRVVVSQSDASRLFSGRIRGAAIRLRGRAARPLAVGKLVVLPAQRERLPSAALGWQAGGEVRVAPGDREGRQAAEPFFEVRAVVVPRPEVALFQGRTGRIRFRLVPEPILQQAYRRVRQLLQARRG